MNKTKERLLKLLELAGAEICFCDEFYYQPDSDKAARFLDFFFNEEENKDRNNKKNG